MSLLQREGYLVGSSFPLSVRQAAHQTPLYTVSVSPGELAGHPGLGMIPSSHMDPAASAARGQAGASNGPGHGRDLGWEREDVWAVLTRCYRAMPALLRLQTRCSWLKKL